jgi:hypothetical protein
MEFRTFAGQACSIRCEREKGPPGAGNSDGMAGIPSAGGMARMAYNLTVSTDPNERALESTRQFESHTLDLCAGIASRRSHQFPGDPGKLRSHGAGG